MGKSINKSCESWNDLKHEVFTEEERSELDLKVDILASIIEARNSKGVSQRELEVLSGVRQPIIARVEGGKTDPQLSTLLKILGALGKRLAIVPKRNKLA